MTYKRTNILNKKFRSQNDKSDDENIIAVKPLMSV